MASFNDSRCAAGGVCATDPLLFTCEVNGAFLLRVIPPTGRQEVISVGDTTDNIVLPDGYTAVSLDLSKTDGVERDISLQIAIENASLLNGSEIICDDSTPRNVVMAGCPLRGMCITK